MNIISSVFSPKTYNLNLNDILQIYEEDRLRKCKISTCCSNCFHVFYLNDNHKICFSVKLGVGLCISSYKTIYLRYKSKLGFSYSSIEYMFVKSNKTV